MNCLGLSFKTTSINFKYEPLEPSIYPYLNFDGRTGSIYITHKIVTPFVSCRVSFETNPFDRERVLVRTLTAKLRTLKEGLFK